MPNQDRIPAEVFSLAEMLCDEMQARGWQTEDVAFRMGGTFDDFVRNLLTIDLLMCVQRDTLLVGDRMFNGLAHAFNVDHRTLRNLDAAWRQAPPDHRAPFTPPDSIFGPLSRRAAFNVVDGKDERGR
jgi:hypothetical protein